MRPSPRTSTTASSDASFSRRYAPVFLTFSPKPSSTRVVSVAYAAAMARLLPPNVDPWSPGEKAAATSERAAQAPMGKPEAMPFAMVTISGMTPKFWNPNGSPVRKTPH